MRKFAATDGACLVVGVGDLAGALDVPSSLGGVPAERLRLKDGALIDAGTVTTFYVDERGAKHVEKRGASWTPIECKWDDELVKVPGGWRVASPSDLLAPAIKRVCRDRILAVLKDEATQTNMLAAAVALARAEASGKAKAKDVSQLELMDAGRQWVGRMQAACRVLIAAADADYADDRKWPPAPDGLADLADQF